MSSATLDVKTSSTAPSAKKQTDAYAILPAENKIQLARINAYAPKDDGDAFSRGVMPGIFMPNGTEKRIEMMWIPPETRAARFKALNLARRSEAKERRRQKREENGDREWKSDEKNPRSNPRGGGWGGPVYHKITVKAVQKWIRNSETDEDNDPTRLAEWAKRAFPPGKTSIIIDDAQFQTLSDYASEAGTELAEGVNLVDAKGNPLRKKRGRARGGRGNRSRSSSRRRRDEADDDDDRFTIPSRRASRVNKGSTDAASSDDRFAIPSRRAMGANSSNAN